MLTFAASAEIATGRTSLERGTKVLRGPGGGPGRWHAAQAVVAASAVLLLFGATPAFADPAQPSNYRSEIVGITPDADGLDVRIVGGDSFIELAAEGIDVVVAGYSGEPYLWFEIDGDVHENVRSPAHFLNDDRLGDASLPPEADAAAEPEWQLVATGGSYAWHDHRTHWMLATPPLGLGPGDQILDSVVPLVVDGVDVEVAVVSVWMPAPSKAPWLLGALVGGAVAGSAVFAASRRHRSVASSDSPIAAPVVPAVAVVAASAALVIGLWQTWSLPSETGPPLTAWAIPASALVVGLGALLASLRRWSAFTVQSSTLVAAVQLVVWAIVRIDVLGHAVLPTAAPFWLDRSVTAGVGVAAIVITYGTVVAIARSMWPADQSVGDQRSGDELLNITAP